MKSKMFLNNVTAVDYAYIDNKGMLIGGSFNPVITVSGEVDDKEKVVVDFSTIKKELKHIIDAKYSGFDHKLWIIEGYSDCTLFDFGGVNIKVETPNLKISAPRSAFKFINVRAENNNFMPAVIDQMRHELIAELNLMHPKTNILVEVDEDYNFWGSRSMNTPMVPFRYTHGLKNSTSWGCQNIAHGHLSYLSAATSKPLETEMLLRQIAADIDGTVFIWKDNITGTFAEELRVGYETERGIFEMILDADYAMANVVVLDTETTVEFLAEAIANQYREALQEAGVVELFVSEGLNKGAIATI